MKNYRERLQVLKLPVQAQSGSKVLLPFYSEEPAGDLNFYVDRIHLLLLLLPIGENADSSLFAH